MKKVRTKLLACSLSACMLITALPQQTVISALAAEQTEAARGDVNGDGKTDNADLDALTTLLGEHVETLFSEQQYASYDITGEGIIDSRDRYALSQYLSGSATEFPTEFGKQLDDTVTLKLTDAACYRGDQIQLMLSVADWKKDIAAYDINLSFDPVLTLDSVEFLSDGGQYVSGKRSVKLSGLYSSDTLWRGDLAILRFTVDKEAEGDYAVKTDGANIFASDYNYYTPVKPEATVSVSDITEPVLVKASAVGSKTVSLSWDYFLTEKPVSLYRIYRGGELVGEATDTAYTDTGLETGKEYEYAVSAVTENGTETKQSAVVKATTAAPKIISAEFPALTVSNQNSDLTVKLANAVPVDSLTLNLTAPDGTKTVRTAELKGAGLDTISYHLDTADLTDGKYEIEAVVSDTDGASASKKVTVSVHNTAPKTVALTAKSGSGSVILTWTLASEASACGYHVFRKSDDGKKWIKIAEIDARDTLSYTDKNLTAGTKYTYSVTVIDSFGMESAKCKAASATAGEDVGEPEITLFKQSKTGRIVGSFDLEVAATDDSGVVSVGVLYSSDEGKTWKTLCENKGDSGKWTVNTADYPDGEYRLKAVAYDAQQHESSAVNTVSVLFDNTAPEQVKNVRTEAVSPNAATLAWDDVADEDRAYFIVNMSSSGSNVSEYRVDKELGLNLNYLVPDTQYTVTVYAVDLSGNAGPVSEPFRFYSSSDVTPPSITSLSIPSNLVSAKVPFTMYVSATDKNAVSRIYLDYSQDKKTWKTLSAYPDRGRGTFTLLDGDLKEGALYIRAYATDNYGNTGKPEEAEIQTLTVDNTAPKKPANLTVTADEYSNQIQWDKSASEDASSYLLERAVGADSDSFEVILDHSARLSYTDNAVQSDETYSYRVAAYDKAGNRSAYTAAAVVTRKPDKEAPVIREVYLSQKNIVCSSFRTLQIIAEDNMKVASITAAYRCKDTDKWTAFETKQAQVTQRDMKVTAVLPDPVLKADSVTVQITAADPSGNKAVEEYSFTVDDTKAKIENFAATPGTDSIEISWKCADSSKVQSFRLLRKIDNGRDYLIDTKMPAEEAVYSFTDSNLSVSGSYTYSLFVTMQSGNEVMISLDPIKVQSVPKAVLRCQRAQVLGAEFEYDATGSENADEITNVTLDYGDGTVDTADSVKQAIFRHTYAEAGVYEAVLTVKNESGFSASESVTITVADAEKMSTVNAVVRSTDGKPAANAVIYVDAGSKLQERIETDSNGKATFVTTAGSHEIGVFGDGYLPLTKTCELAAGSTKEILFSVVKDQLVDASFKVERMTLSQIKAAGIQVDDPQNCNIVNINVEMEYDSAIGIDRLSAIVDMYTGRVFTSSSTSSNYVYYFYPVSSKANTVVLMRVPAKAQYLKEFFQVDMILVNKASSEFSLTDCTVSLDLPSGLTLMEQSGKSESRVVSFDRLSGGQQKKISWIVRGDRSGEYSFGADFSGTLKPFDEPISMHFQSKEKIKVIGQNAAHITVNFNPVMVGKSLLAEIVVENRSSIDLYEVKTDFKDIFANVFGSDEKPAGVSPIQTRFTGKDGILKVIDLKDKIEVLHPGEQFSVLYLIADLPSPHPYQLLFAIEEKLEAQAPGNVTVQIYPVEYVDVNSPFYGLNFDPETDFLFMVKNKNGDELSGAQISVAVTVDGTSSVFSGTTDDRGRLVVPRGDPNIASKVDITAEHYNPYTEDFFMFPASISYCMNTFVLQGDFEESDYGLQYASIGGVNVLTKHYNIKRGDTNPFSLYVVCRSEVSSFELRQGSTVIQTIDTAGKSATFTDLKANDFSKGKDIYVRVTHPVSGDPIDTPLNIEVVNPDPSDYDAVVDDIIRTTSSYDVTVTVPAPGIVAEWGGDLDLTLPFPKFDEDDDLPDLTWEFTESSISVEIGMGKDIEFKIGSSVGLKFSLGVSFSAEIDMDSDTACVSGTVSVGMSGSAGTTLYQNYYPVPFYVAIALEASLGASATVRYTFDFGNPANSGWSYSIDGTAGIAVTPELGLGVDNVASISLYGTAGINISGVLSASNEEPHVSRVWLNGAIGIRAELLEWEMFNLQLFSGSITFYPKGYTGRPREWNGFGMLTESGDSVISAMTDSSQYRPFTADEIPAAGAWNGTLGDSAAVLRTGISGGSAPVLACDGTNAVLVWIEKDASRGVVNAAYAVYSVYDPETASWSEPCEVDDNQNGDSMPVLYAGADGIRLVYLESGSVYEETPELEDYTKQLVFKTAKFDAESGSFGDFRTIEANADGGFASLPQYVQADGTTYLVWRSNQNGLVFGTDRSNAIFYAAETEEGWSEPTALFTELPAITGMSCGVNADGKPVCAYVTDADSNFADPSDRKLYVTDLDGNVTELASGSISAPQFTSIPGRDASGLVWYQDGKLFASQDFAGAEELYDGTAFGLTDRFMTAGNQVLYLRNTENAAALFSVQYDAASESFTEPVCLESGDNLYYEHLALTQLGDQTLYAMTRSTADLSEETIARSSEMVGGMLREVSDLSVSDVQFSAADVAGGKALPVNVTVRNSGTAAAESLTLNVLDTEGNVIASDTQSASLISGEAKTVSFSPVLPESIAAEVYTVSVTAFENDRTPDDNCAALDLSKTDIAVHTELEYFNNSTLLTIFAENRSNVPSSVVMHVKPISAESDTMVLISDQIAPHTSAFWQVDAADVLGDLYRSFILVTAETEIDDVCDDNNSAVVMLNKTGFDPASIGDINLNGSVELEDAMLALRAYTRQIAMKENLGLSPTQQRCADVDRDGLIDLPDAMMILRYYVKHSLSGTTTDSFEVYLEKEKNGGAEA